MMELALPDDNKVLLPQELYPVQEKVEEYVSNRIIKQFAPSFARKLGVDVPHEQLLGAIVETLQGMPPPDMVHAEAVDYHLLFRHECLALGCRDMECTLCQFNPVRLCERNFGKKYLVSDALKAKCGASIKVEMVDALGQRVEKDLPGIQFEVYLVDGVVYKEKGGEGRELPEDDLRVCFRLHNHKEEALLQHKSGGAHPSHQRKVLLKLDKGQVLLPDLVVTDSSEALLQGRRPPFRLLVMAVEEVSGKLYPGVHYAASEEFVVATRRVKQANKADIPLVDDHVSKIEHIGRETVKKLQNLRTAATEIGVEIAIPDTLISVTTVGQFRMLVEMADKDIQLRKILQIVLKLSKEKWEEAANHAVQAVVPDFRKRVWYPPGHNMGIGLLFNCKYAAVQLKDPVSLVQVPGPQGTPVKIVPEDQLDPSSLNILRQLKSQAVAAWWSPRHPGWGVFRDPAEAAAPPPPKHPVAIAAPPMAPPRMLEAPRPPAYKYAYAAAAPPPGLPAAPIPQPIPPQPAQQQLELAAADAPQAEVAMEVAAAAPPQVSDPMDAAATSATPDSWLHTEAFAQAVEQVQAQAQAQAQAAEAVAQAQAAAQAAAQAQAAAAAAQMGVAAVQEQAQAQVQEVLPKLEAAAEVGQQEAAQAQEQQQQLEQEQLQHQQQQELERQQAELLQAQQQQQQPQPQQEADEEPVDAAATAAAAPADAAAQQEPAAAQEPPAAA